MRRWILILMLVFPCLLTAQSEILEDYVETGLKSNLALQRQDLEVSAAIQQMKQAKALFFPQISFNATYTLATGGRAIAFPVGDLLNPVYSTLNQLLAEDAFPTIENVNEQFLPNNFHETKLTLVQPLFNSDIWFAYQARKNQVALAEAQRNAFAAELAHQIRIAYYQHLQALEGVKIYQQGREILEEVQRVNQSLVRNHVRTKDVISSVDAELAGLDRDLAEANKQVELSQAYLNFLLNQPLDSTIRIDEALIAANPETLTLDGSSGERQELEALRQGIAANQRLVDMKRYDAVLPDLYLAAEGGFQGFGYTFDEDQDYVLGQVGLTWDIFQGGKKKAATQSARIELEKLENQYQEVEQQLRLQVVETQQSVFAGEEALIAEEKAYLARQEAFDLVSKRYREGKALVLELTQARNELTSAQLARSLARFQLRIAIEEYKKATAQS